ncbi:hypothetical protein BGX30_004342 [Mortierella sp. GBA39]|nr:hypothetical protein BGX30_004342 [Mortierella sp. GBA39]
MSQDKNQVPHPSHRNGGGNSGKTKLEDYLDCLLVHRQHDAQGNNNNGHRYNTFVKDLVDAPHRRQRRQLNGRRIPTPPKGAAPYDTSEFRNFCVKFVAQFKTISPDVVFLALKYLTRMVESLKNMNQRPSGKLGTVKLLFTAALVLARFTRIHKTEIESSRKMLLELLDYRLVTTPAEYAD